MFYIMIIKVNIMLNDVKMMAIIFIGGYNSV